MNPENRELAGVDEETNYPTLVLQMLLRVPFGSSFFLKNSQEQAFQLNWPMFFLFISDILVPETDLTCWARLSEC